jgi:hypothetical protein
MCYQSRGSVNGLANPHCFVRQRFIGEGQRRFLIAIPIRQDCFHLFASDDRNPSFLKLLQSRAIHFEGIQRIREYAIDRIGSPIALRFVSFMSKATNAGMKEIAIEAKTLGKRHAPTFS